MTDTDEELLEYIEGYLGDLRLSTIQVEEAMDFIKDLITERDVFIIKFRGKS